MNEIIVKGIIKDIQYSHNIGEIEYNKANLLVKRDDGTEDVLTVKFKKFSNKYKENDLVELRGNIRSFSCKENDKNKIEEEKRAFFNVIRAKGLPC
mgnify:CR=1 FL=1